jgi:hypothetical protein
MVTTIDPELAASLINEYRQQNAVTGDTGLLTPDLQSLNGYFIDRESLESLLDNPNVVGINLMLAKDPDFVGHPRKVFTVLFAGAEKNRRDGSAPYVNTGNICGPPPPCPPMCIKL